MKISLYIPTTDAEPGACVDEALACLSQITGGASAHHLTGAWVIGDHRLLTEPVTQVYTFAEATLVDQCMARVASLARDIKARLRQEAVLYTQEPMGLVTFL